jgi:F-type H+-transporting ATPase subunit epsilon
VSNIRLEIVTAERVVFSDDVDMVIAPGIQGELGILPHHTPLMTTLQAGALRIKKDGVEDCMAISGGFLEVRPERVIVLADACERAEEIDIARAEEAKKKAMERLAQHPSGMDEEQSEAALRRAMIRLSVADRIKTKRRRTP